MNTAEKQKLQTLINLIIEEQISLPSSTNLSVLDEGIVDSIKQFSTSVAGKVQVAWDSVKKNLDALASKMIMTLTNGKNSAAKIYNENLQTFKQVVEAFKMASSYAQEMGQPIPNIPQELSMVANIEQQAKAVGDEMIADAGQAKSLANANKTQNESIYNINGYAIFLAETNKKQQKTTKTLQEQKNQLNEVGAVAGALGGFAILKLSLEGLYLLFKKIKNPKAAELAKWFHDRVEQLNNVEQNALKIIPDSVAFTFWLMTTNKGWQQILQNAKSGNTEALQQAYVNFQQNPEQASKVRKRMFIAMIGVLVGKGIFHLAHAGAQSLTAVHAAVEGAHAAEVGLGMVEVIKDAALAIGAVSVDSVTDMIDSAFDSSNQPSN